MAFTRLSLTRSGQTLWAKFQQGKGLHITRVAIGDGRLEGNTLYNATGLINERLSLAVDAVLLTEDSVQAAIVTTLDNKFVEESFSFRELAIFARDPDTMQEVVYLNDNAGEDAETIPSGTSGIKVYERLKFLVKADSSSSITFEASGNPLYLVAEDIELKADLDPVTRKLKLEQLPEGVASGDIDCGTFDDADALSLHESSQAAHPVMLVDGNAVEVSAAAETLEEHIADPLAHQNIHLDGNMN